VSEIYRPTGRTQ